MKIKLCSENDEALKHWKNSLAGYKPETIKNINRIADELTADIIVIYHFSKNRLEAISAIRAFSQRSLFLVLDNTPDFDKGREALKAGARGYGNAFMDAIHLKQAVKHISSGAIWLYPDFLAYLIAQLDSPGEKAEVDKTLEKLTERERETALLIKKGLKNREIADSLGITVRTVKAHLAKIYEKLNVRDRIELALLLS